MLTGLGGYPQIVFRDHPTLVLQGSFESAVVFSGVGVNRENGACGRKIMQPAEVCTGLR